METETLLRLPEVIRRVGISRSSIYAKMKAGEFPPSVRLGPRSIAFPASAIEKYISDLIAASQPHEAG
jgi:prophage regulatory protein